MVTGGKNCGAGDAPLRFERALKSCVPEDNTEVKDASRGVAEELRFVSVTTAAVVAAVGAPTVVGNTGALAAPSGRV